MKTLCLGLVLFAFGLGAVPAVHAEDYADGYEAGRQWAAENNVIDDDFHSDRSEDFDNGVRQYAVEQEQRQDEAE